MTPTRGTGTARTKAGRSKGPKTSEKSSVALVEQPHGGAIQIGNPGNKGGGRPRDQIRADALEALTKGPGKLAQILDGVSYTTHVGKCEACGHLHMSSATATPTEVKPADVVKAALALDKLAGEENATLYAMLFHRIRELTLELGGEKGPILLAAFHEAHRTLTEGK